IYAIARDGSILPRLVVLREQQQDSGRDASYPDLGRLDPDCNDGDRLCCCVVVLYRESGAAERARAAERCALSLPAQQVVFRRTLCPHLRATGKMAWAFSVEARRWLVHRW